MQLLKNVLQLKKVVVDLSGKDRFLTDSISVFSARNNSKNYFNQQFIELPTGKKL